jgi:hypothetical protein
MAFISALAVANPIIASMQVLAHPVRRKTLNGTTLYMRRITLSSLIARPFTKGSFRNSYDFKLVFESGAIARLPQAVCQLYETHAAEVRLESS